MPRGKTTTKLCPTCNRDVSLFAYNRHVKSHLAGKLQQPEPFITGDCRFCGKTYSSKIGLGNHATRCRLNPNRVLQQVSEEGRARAIAATKNRQWTQEQKDNHSRVMKLAVENNPQAYTSANRGRTKQYTIDGITLQGKWEVDFYLWAKGQGLEPIRPVEGFRYEWNGVRTYYPDFYISALDVYVEVKGYETDRDRAKWLQFPKKLCIIKEYEIKEIRKGCFVGL